MYNKAHFRKVTPKSFTKMNLHRESMSHFNHFTFKKLDIYITGLCKTATDRATIKLIICIQLSLQELILRSFIEKDFISRYKPRNMINRSQMLLVT